MAVTDAWLRANDGKPVEEEYEKTDRDGLSVRVSTKGVLSFQIRYRFDGKPARLKIGTYPALTLKQAREENERLRGLLFEGHNPKLVKVAERTGRISEETLEQSFTNWFGKNRLGKVTRSADHLRTFHLHVFPVIGKLPVKKVTPLHWYELLSELAESSPSLVYRIITNAKLYYRWAWKFGVVESDPVGRLSAKRDFGCERNHVERTLSPEEIKILWLAFKNTRVSARNTLIYKFMLLTGCRMKEIRLAERKHFNLVKKVWIVPPELSKNGKEIKRPIIDEIRPLLDLALTLSPKTKYIFVSDRTGQPPGGPAVRDAVDCFKNYAEKKLDYHWRHWSPHDLRRTARTMLSKHTQPHVAEKILGHEFEGNMKVYDRYDYLDEQREALASLYHEIAQLVGEV